MISSTRSHTSNPHRARKAGGFSLVELMIAAGLSAVVLTAILTMFLFLSRSGANLRNYSDMEYQARKALEIFAEDVRQASAITWNSNSQITLVVNSANVVYLYSSSTGMFSRVDASSNRELITGITAGTFVFRAFNVAGAELPLAAAADLTLASSSTKQLQISLESSRTLRTVARASNTVLSARFILRNKIVTA
jgi:Tfp pilus assembly protein PilW